MTNEITLIEKGPASQDDDFDGSFFVADIPSGVHLSKADVFAAIADNLQIENTKTVENRYFKSKRGITRFHETGNALLEDLDLMDELNRPVEQGSFAGSKPVLSTTDLVMKIRSAATTRAEIREAVGEALGRDTFKDLQKIHYYAKKSLYAISEMKRGDAVSSLVEILRLSDTDNAL